MSKALRFTVILRTACGCEKRISQIGLPREILVPIPDTEALDMFIRSPADGDLVRPTVCLVRRFRLRTCELDVVRAMVRARENGSQTDPIEYREIVEPLRGM